MPAIKTLQAGHCWQAQIADCCHSGETKPEGCCRASCSTVCPWAGRPLLWHSFWRDTADFQSLISRTEADCLFRVRPTDLTPTLYDIQVTATGITLRCSEYLPLHTARKEQQKKKKKKMQQDNLIYFPTYWHFHRNDIAKVMLLIMFCSRCIKGLIPISCSPSSGNKFGESFFWYE